MNAPESFVSAGLVAEQLTVFDRVIVYHHESVFSSCNSCFIACQSSLYPR